MGLKTSWIITLTTNDMTDEEKKTVVQEVLNQIKTDSQSVDELA